MTPEESAIDGLLAARPADRAAYGRLALGQVVGGWRVEAYLGAGRSAEVYRVVSTGFGGDGALKLLVDGTHGLPERFVREREVLSTLAIPSLPRYFGAGEWNGMPYYVMEYLQPLFLPLDRAQVVPFAVSLAMAVRDLHQAGYVHCDLKPGNILLRRGGEPVLIDLGLVRRIGERGGDGVGTMGYAAPEQLLKGEAGVRADVFALGKILRAAGGKAVSHHLRAVIRRATHEDPDERYAGAAEFAAAVKGRPIGRWAAAAVAALALAAAAPWLAPGPRAAAPSVPAGAPAAPETVESRPATPEEEFQSALAAARSGDVEAEAYVAECLYHGRGTPVDRSAAAEWYRLAAEDGNPGAQDSLGCCLLRGDGCRADPAEAVRWFETAAAHEHPSAMNNLAFCLLAGKGVPRDDHRGFVWAKAAADLGHPPSQTLVGECYLDGRGVERDLDSAMVWLTRAASKGNRRAKTLLEALRAPAR